MDEGISPIGIAPLATHSDNPMDLDLIEEFLLGGGCWLENIDDVTDFYDQTSTIPFTSSSVAATFDMPSPWPFLDEITNSRSIPVQSPSQITTQDDKESSNSDIHQEVSPILDSPQAGALVVNRSGSGHHNNACSSSSTVVDTATPSSYQIRNVLPDGCSEQLDKFFWIGPQTFPTSPEISVTRRLLTAMNYIKDSATNKDILIQIWAPVSRGGSLVLTTINQPFTLDTRSARLLSYRNISEGYHFAAEEKSDTCLGLPGRVYVGEVPEWTPDVRFFRADEYPRVIQAQKHDVRGTLALPVFEQSSQSCLGVIEVVMTTQKVNYRHELEFLCKALEAVDLRSSGIPSAPNAKEESTGSYKTVVPEIQEVLRSACNTHGLPLAQAWVPCIQQGKEGCRHNDKNLVHCVSTIDDACFILDPQIQGFHEACSEHHLLKGQGVVGGAFLRNKPCFCPDITNYSQTEYPLSHHARVFGLCAVVAIRFRSIYTGCADYVFEFFLPSDCRDPEDQRQMLSSLSVVIQQSSKSLRVVTDEELEIESSPVSNNDDYTKSAAMVSDGSPMIKSECPPLSTSSSPEAGPATIMQDGGRSLIPPLVQQEDASRGEILEDGVTYEVKQEQKEEFDGIFKVNAYGDCESDSGCVPVEEIPSSSKPSGGDRKRTKSDKVISVEVLRQHFAGSLKDAAKSIGVCPTTLKRICRQHGIKRWPSRKIKKVGHSLQKLQVVMDSVHGASGSFQIGSFYSTFPNLASSPNALENGSFSPSKEIHLVSLAPPLNHEMGGKHQLSPSSAEPYQHLSPSSDAPKSPSSSYSQSSSSSQCCSSGGQNQQPATGTNNSAGSIEPLHGGGNSLHECTLKRARSDDADLVPPEQETNMLIPRYQSQMTLGRGGGNQTAETQEHSLPKHGSSEKITIHGNDAWRVKVTYGEEKIRFRMGKGWGFKELEQELVRRYSIGDPGGFHIKYLDDDLEWVLLTCDADLEECIEICRSLKQQTIKLALQISRNHSRCSVGSNKHPGQ